MKHLGCAALCVFVGFFAACAPAASPEAVITDFTFPWSDRQPPRTEFRTYVADSRWHFSFDVEDRDVVSAQDWQGEATLDGEDRVEIFFTADAELRDYWCIEIDPQGRVHDYHARHYRQFDSTWNCAGLKTAGERTADGYHVRGSIPLTTLSDLVGKPIARGSELRVGLFRAEFYGEEAATQGEANDNWLSWVRPAADKPDFHVPSALRTWRLP